PLIDLWIVPQNVSRADLGAILPVVSGVNVLALPLAIVVVPFSRWLAIYMKRRELGKVKALLRTMLAGTAVAVALMGAFVWLCAPRALAALHVSEAGFPTVLLLTGMLAALAPVFAASLQGLRKFGTVAGAGFLSAGARLAVSFVLIPIRTFGGYLLGVAAACCVKMAVTVVGLRRELGSGVPARPFFKADGREQFRYVIPLAVSLTIWNLVMSWQATVVRLNLSESESAAYFFITRFADVGQWAGLSLLFVAFPTIAAAEAEVQGCVLKRTLALTLLSGAAVAVGYGLFLGPLMRAVPLWHDYLPAVGLIALYTFRYAMGVSVGAFMSCEQAAGNFRYLGYLVPCVIVESVALAFIHRLDVLLWWLTFTVAVQLVIVWAVVLRRGRALK
ncbi:MAG: hypothetical protein KBT68_08750, partial [bacterium]|nr:hypothetical protein [Candidatus Colisoma equi]